MDVSDPAVFGPYGGLIGLLVTAIKVLWTTLQAERAKRDLDQAAILPALEKAATAVAASVTAIDRVNVLYEHRVRGER